MEYERLMEENGLEIRIPNKQLTFCNEDKKIRFVSIGEKNNLDIKSVLLIGETGAGKTTMLNAIYNHFYGVGFEDNHRMKVHAEEEGCREKDFFESQTEYITGYLFYSKPFMKYKYNIRVIDTPGINDTRGIETQDRVAKQIKELLKNENYGVIDLHCLGFVVRDQNRLLESFKKVAKDCLENFGRDTEYITYLLRTHTTDDSDAFNEMCKKMGVYTRIQFAFENGCLYKPNKSDSPSSTKALKRSELDWNETSEVFMNFFESLSGSRPVSLQLSRELVQLKMNLEQDKQNLFNQIVFILNQFLASRDYQIMLRDFKNNMETNKNWTGMEPITEVKRIPVNEKANWYHLWPHSHNCTKCQQSCISVCHILRSCPTFGNIVHLLRPILTGSWDDLLHILTRSTPRSSTPSPCDVCGCAASYHEEADYILQKEIAYKEVTNEDMRERFKTAEFLHEQLDEIACNSMKEEKEMIQSIARMIHYMVLQTEELEKISRVKECLSTKEIIDEIVHVTLSGNNEFCSKICEVSPDFLRSLDEAIRATEIDKNAWRANFENEKKKLNSNLSKCLEYMEKAKAMRLK